MKGNKIKYLSIALAIIEVLFFISVYIVKGKAGAVVWSAWVFIFAPIACIMGIVTVVILIRKIMKKEKIGWNILSVLLSVIMIYPITILFGASFLTYPLSHDKEAIDIINPVKESVVLGGKSFKTHAVWPSECYAYDILKKPYDCNSDKIEDYGIYLADVAAPISGTVIEAYDKEDDIAPNTEEFKSSLGNYIYLKVDKTDTYIILAHLEKGSIRVKEGSHVEQGEIIAKVGNSGTTSEPHLHLQHQLENPQDVKIPITAQGLPMNIKKARGTEKIM